MNKETITKPYCAICLITIDVEKEDVHLYPDGCVVHLTCDTKPLDEILHS